MPRDGWLNDPNGLCQFRGRYHFFYQYAPDWPQGHLKYWGHSVSDDLVHWEDWGVALSPDIPQDRNGAYSGSAWVERGAAPDGGDLMRVWYTGNVRDHSNGNDCIHVGREAHQIEVDTADGRTFSPKRVELSTGMYPADLTLHVRDPKVWQEADGSWRMLLGARTLADAGQALLYRSTDGRDWELAGRIDSAHPFGFMWECPGYVRLDGHEYLLLSPQGLTGDECRFQNLWQAGYLPLRDPIDQTSLVDEGTFVEWDQGFDFYAPQNFTDDAGRHILVGWMGLDGETGYTSAPEGMDWCHCLTVPRQLSVGEDGDLLQWPVAEVDRCRDGALALPAGEDVMLAGPYADVVVPQVGEAPFELVLDKALALTWDGQTLALAFSDEAVGAGRTVRRARLGSLSDVRVLVDGSAVEVFCNGGATCLATRWFPQRERLTIRSTAAATVYPLKA